jgi:hypothetical protein
MIVFLAIDTILNLCQYRIHVRHLHVERYRQHPGGGIKTDLETEQ